MAGIQDVIDHGIVNGAIDPNADDVYDQIRNYGKSLYQDHAQRDQAFSTFDNFNFTDFEVGLSPRAQSFLEQQQQGIAEPITPSTQAAPPPSNVFENTSDTKEEPQGYTPPSFESYEDAFGRSGNVSDIAENFVRFAAPRVDPNDNAGFDDTIDKLKDDVKILFGKEDADTVNRYINEFVRGEDNFSFLDRINQQRNVELLKEQGISPESDQDGEVGLFDRARQSFSRLSTQDAATVLSRSQSELDDFRKRQAIANQLSENTDQIVDSLRQDKPLDDTFLDDIERLLPTIGSTIADIQSGNKNAIQFLTEQIKGAKSYIDLREGERATLEQGLIESVDKAANDFSTALVEQINTELEPSEAQARFAEQVSQVGNIDLINNPVESASNLIELAKISFENGTGFLDTLAESSASLLRSIGYTFTGTAAGTVISPGAGSATGGAAGAGLSAYKDAHGQFVFESIRSRVERDGIELTEQNAVSEIRKIIDDEAFMTEVANNANRYALTQTAVASATGAFAPFATTIRRIAGLGAASTIAETAGVVAGERVLTGETPEQRREQAEAGGVQADRQAVISALVLSTVGAGGEIAGAVAGRRLGARLDPTQANITGDPVQPESIFNPDGTQVGDRPAPNTPRGTNEQIRRNATAINASNRYVAYTAEELAEFRDLKGRLRRIDTDGEQQFNQIARSLIDGRVSESLQKRIDQASLLIADGDFDGAATALTRRAEETDRKALQPLKNALLTLADVDNRNRTTFGVRYEPDRDSGILGITDGQLLNAIKDPDSEFAKLIKGSSQRSSRYNRAVELLQSGDINALSEYIAGLSVRSNPKKRQLNAVSQQLNNIARQGNRADTFVPIVSADGTVIKNATPENIRETIQAVNDQATSTYLNENVRRETVEAQFISTLSPDENVLANTPADRTRLEAIKIEDHLDQLVSEKEVIDYIKNAAVLTNLRERFGSEQGLREFFVENNLDITDQGVREFVSRFNHAPETGVDDGIINRLNDLIEGGTSTDLIPEAQQQDFRNAVQRELSRIQSLYQKDIQSVIADGFATNDLVFTRIRDWINN